MPRIAIGVSIAAALAAGCAGRVQTAQPGPDHPANPAAAEAPLPPPPRTLTPDTPVAESDETHGVVPRQVPMPGGPPGQPAQGGMKGMSHGEMGHAAHATPPASAPTLYACPMHPEVTSTNPNDRCPKCGMKINKPVKPATAPTTQPAPPAQHSHEPAGDNK